MSNKKGFTLTEVLLAAMIVGIIGIALAALTTAAVRESGVGRTRIMLRNQISLFLRQLRQDVQQASSLTVDSEDQKTITLHIDGNDENDVTIKYVCCANDVATCVRERTKNETRSETVLNHVQCNLDATIYPKQFFTTQNISEGDNAILRAFLVVGADGTPPVKEFLDETFVLP